MNSRLPTRLLRQIAAKQFAQQLIDLVRQWPWVYPRGIERSAKDWIQRAQARLGWYSGLRGDWYSEVYPGGINIHSLPEAAETAARVSVAQVTTQRYPEASVSFLKDAHLFSNEGLVFTRDNRVLAQYFHFFGVRRLSTAILSRPFSHVRLRVQRVSGAVGLLAAPQGRNYYHWIFDVLPRIHLLSRWAEIIESYAVPGDLSAVQLESLGYLGVKESQLLFLREGSRLRCHHLYVPSLPGSEGSTPPWALEFLRSSLLPASENVAGRGRLIYLVRGSLASRPILNEAELIARLEGLGFQAVTPESLSFAEQVALFRDARVVVAAHGAALANLAFATKARVLELFSADYARADCYFTLACQLGHTYDSWLDPHRAGPSKAWGAITADLRAVEERVKSLLRAVH